jgi:hypothetical protein
MGGMERPEQLLIDLMPSATVAFLVVAAGVALLIRATTAKIHNANGMRFSLRTLLIATTLVAVVLGAIIYLTRR